MAQVVQCLFTRDTWQTIRWLAVKKAKVGDSVRFKSLAALESEGEDEWTVAEVYGEVEKDDRYVYQAIK